MTSPGAKGAYGEALVVADLIKNGFVPHMPVIHTSPYDILVTKGNMIFRVQVKLRNIYRGAVEVTLRRISTKGYKENTGFDILALVCEEGIAYTHISEFDKAINLRVHPPKSNQKKHIRWFKDYKCIHRAIEIGRQQQGRK